MNYLKHYCNLIRKAENRTPPEGYTEKHHIFPKSIFGNNNRIVLLTGREHYIAHALLEKIFIKKYGLNNWKTQKMSHAFWCMNIRKNKESYHNSILYETSKINHSISVSKRMQGNKHSLGNVPSEETRQKIIKANTGRPCKEEVKQKISKCLKGRKKAPFSEETKRKMSESRKGKSIHGRTQK